MKKLFTMTLVAILATSALAGCAGSTTPTPSTAPTPSVAAPTPEAPTPTPEAVAPTPEAAPAGTKGSKSGLGKVVTIKSSKDVSEKDGKPVDGLAQVDNIMASVSVDADGKIVSVTIDNAQTKVNFDKEGKITSDLAAEQKTKVELADAYGMKKASSIGKEWYEQIVELEKWMTGKTIDEVKAMKTYKKDDAHTNVPDEADLKSSVTISVEGYVQAVERAIATGKETPSVAVKTGLGQNISIKSSKDAGEKDGLAQVDTVMATVALDASGKILAVTIDNAQTKVNYDKEGKLITDISPEQKTKVELADDYGMKKASTIGKEWYEQIAELEKWMTGKTIDEVKAMKTYQKDDAHPSVPDEADLKSSVTVSVESYVAAVEEAVKNAK